MAASVLEAAEHTLDDVALALDLPIVLDLDFDGMDNAREHPPIIYPAHSTSILRQEQFYPRPLLILTCSPDCYRSEVEFGSFMMVV